MFNWLKKKNDNNPPALQVDIHSHLLPGLDDGVKTFEEALTILRHFKALGYKKVITTPHVMSDIYRNTSESILEKSKALSLMIKQENLDIELQTAAEYYLDEVLLSRVVNNTPLLTFGDRYLLFETNFLTEPLNLKEFIFQAATKGYRLILAHPERYIYLHKNFEKVQDLLTRGVLLQVNISSLTGYYSKQAQRMSYELIDRGWVHMLGSDCHHFPHAELLTRAHRNNHYQKALTLPLLNNSLL